jgi:hypothetical protein
VLTPVPAPLHGRGGHGPARAGMPRDRRSWRRHVPPPGPNGSAGAQPATAAVEPGSARGPGGPAGTLLAGRAVGIASSAVGAVAVPGAFSAAGCAALRCAGRGVGRHRGAVAARAGRPLGGRGTRRQPRPAIEPMRDRRLRRPGSSADPTPRSVPSAHTSTSAGGTRLLRWPDASGCPGRLPRPVVDVRDRDVAGPAATGCQGTHGPRDRLRLPSWLRRTGTRVPSPTPPQHAIQRRRHRCRVWSTGRSRPTAVPWERHAACPGASAHGAGAPLPARVVAPGRLRRAGPPPGPPVRPGPGRRRLSRPSGFDDAREDARALVTARPTSVRPLSVRGERRVRSPGSTRARRPPGGAPTGPRPRGAACLPRAGTTALRRSGHDGDEAVGAGTAGGTGPDRAGWQPDDATADVSWTARLGRPATVSTTVEK